MFYADGIESISQCENIMILIGFSKPMKRNKFYFFFQIYIWLIVKSTLLKK